MFQFRKYRKLLFYCFLGLSLVLLGSGAFLYYQFLQTANQTHQTNYEIYRKAPFNQPSYYPVNQSVSSRFYQAIGTWTGRLILPTKEQRQAVKGVLFEVYHADTTHQNLVGKIVNLRWSNDPEVQAYVHTVTQDVHFTEQTQQSKKQGNLHPDRLNNWQKVDPLESLAGARPDDQVMVLLKAPIFVEEKGGDRPTLLLTKEPIQITGRYYGLVTIIRPTIRGSDRFLVHHFNSDSQQFDGLKEIIRIPQVPADWQGVFRSKNQGIEKSPYNPTGWYIYGAKDADGIFVTQAIAPRTLFRLQPDKVLLGKKAAINYINKKYWKDTPAQKGKAQTILLDPTAKQINEAMSSWREGDIALVLHTFGGIGGKKAESTLLGVVTGHFAYGLARVVRDPLTQELRFDIEYRQVYAHNPDGIVAGTISWPGYMGDLQRGWLGNRPVSDILVKLDAVTEDYDFDGIKVSPLKEFTLELDIMMARYRIGDGTGASVVTPAISCVQDSNQALYVTIKRIEAAIQSNPQIQDWLQRYPNHPQTKRFQQLVKLGRSLENQLVPLGIVRSDWHRNTQTLAATHLEGNSFTHFLAALTTWRTLLPRRAHDEIATTFLKNRAPVWLIRTNQVGGFDPDIKPLAPTALLGHRIK
ncbi:MAG TPA: abortive infection protein [Cyanobacteria bacterium UBA8553]|nr:abortive infection protein [Cyanobacteria bacterium UBA8553]